MNRFSIWASLRGKGQAEGMDSRISEAFGSQPFWRRNWLLRKARWIRYPGQWRWLMWRKTKDWYRSVTHNGMFFEESELWMCSLRPEKILEQTLKMFAPKSVVDLGCGVGRSLDFFHERGIDVIGVEGSKLAISRARHKELIRRFDLSREVDLGRRFDLVWSFEVVEHIHPRHVETLMRTICRHADRTVLSAARPGQGGEGHFNEQPPEYWIERFAAHGFRCNPIATETLRSLPEQHSRNMLVFERELTASTPGPSVTACRRQKPALP